MSARKIMALILFGIIAVTVVVTRPDLRRGVAEFFEAAKEDVGPGEPSPTIGDEVKVYVPRGDQYYHRRTCPRLEGTTAVPTPLSKARVLCQPCPQCDPPR
ncbi:MAG: hypothetical protein ACYS8K_05485 [Planctomycetota bacterium]|jgi:hypothetical protein